MYYTKQIPNYLAPTRELPVQRVPEEKNKFHLEALLSKPLGFPDS